MEKAGSLLGPLIKSLGIADSVRLTRLMNDWNKLFEEPLSSHMSPSKLYEGELLLNVDSPIWMQQLNFCKRDLLTKLIPYEVRDIRFRIGRITKKRQNTSDSQEFAEISSEDESFVTHLVSFLGDDGLKESVRKAAEKSLRAAKPRKKGTAR
jgi:hypothetical protein